MVCKFSRGAVGLPFSHHIGVDLRWQVDAYVVIVHDSIPDSETVRQTISRGTRSYGPQEGILFAVGDPSETEYQQQQLFLHRGKNFKEGAANIKIAKKYLNSRFDKNVVASFLKETEGEWIKDSLDFINSKSDVAAQNLNEIRTRM